jgi:hypothetical protein
MTDQPVPKSFAKQIETIFEVIKENNKEIIRQSENKELVEYLKTNNTHLRGAIESIKLLEQLRVLWYKVI